MWVKQCLHAKDWIYLVKTKWTVWLNQFDRDINQSSDDVMEPQQQRSRVYAWRLWTAAVNAGFTDVQELI